MHWFAVSTGTLDARDSCRDTTCGIGYIPQEINGVVSCFDMSSMCWTNYNDTRLKSCSQNNITPNNNNRCQCCDKQDTYGHCCGSKETVSDTGSSQKYCVNDTNAEVIFEQYAADENTILTLICDGTVLNCDDVNNINSMCQNHEDDTLYCDGELILIKKAGDSSPHYISPNNQNYITETFMSGSSSSDGKQCIYRGEGNGGWTPNDSDDPCSSTAAPVNWSVVFNNN